MRTLRAAGRDVRRARRAALAVHRRSSGRSPTATSCGDCVRGRRRGAARGDAAQAARRDAQPPGLRRHQHHRHAEPARGGGRAPASARFVFTSTTSAFGRALTPPPGAPAAWITEDVAPVPRNIYGVTKIAAEDALRARPPRPRPAVPGPAHVALLPRGRRPRRGRAPRYADANLKVNELLYRRVDIEDVVDAHLLALERAPAHRLRPLHRQRDDAVHARGPRRAARRRAGGGAPAASPSPRRSTRGAAGGCSPRIERVYVNAARAQRARLGAAPRLRATRSSGSRPARTRAARSPLAVGAKGYHAEPTGPYTVRLDPRCAGARVRDSGSAAGPLTRDGQAVVVLVALGHDVLGVRLRGGDRPATVGARQLDRGRGPDRQRRRVDQRRRWRPA